MIATTQEDGASAGLPPPAAARAAGARAASAVDAALVRRFTAGDDAAFVEIAARYRHKMHALALRYLRNHADAEEIAQDTLIRAHRGLARFRGDSSLSTWLHRIAFNLSQNRLRRNHGHRLHLTHSFDCPPAGGGTATLSDLVASDLPDPQRVAASREFSAIIAACMDRLGSQQRDILVMRTVLSRPYAEIARELGVNIGTVKSRICRARENLRGLLGRSCPGLSAGAPLREWFAPARSGGRVAVASA